MSAATRNRLVSAARGERPVDLLLKNSRMINVFTGAVEKTAIAVDDGHVVGFGDYATRESVDLAGRFAAPGFIDAHVHIESAMVQVAEFARAVLPHGTTAVVADPHEIANVLGTAGIDYILENSRDLPVEVFIALPSCVPATEMETAGARLTPEDLRPYLSHPRVKALAEMMNYPGVIAEDPRVMAKLAMAEAAGKPCDGHAPGLSGPRLYAYLAAGIASDHECTTAAEAREKLAAGMRIMIREGTGAKNLDALLPVITRRTAHRTMWCTDDRSPRDLLAEGHIDAMLRRAIRAGLDPVIAVQMATLHPAEYFGLTRRGAIAPGRRADLVIFEDLADPVPSRVYAAGRLVARDGTLVAGMDEPSRATVPVSMNVSMDRLDFRIPARGRRIRLIEAIPGQIFTRAEITDARISYGEVVPDPAADILKIVVVERHYGTGRMGRGFLRGLGLKKGALASTVAHDSHNIVAVGTGDADLRTAVSHVVDMGGGMAVVESGRVLAALALPIAGLMSLHPIGRVRHEMDALVAAARGLGARPADPFMSLGFLALPVIPQLKITDHGLVDVDRFRVVGLFAD